MNKTCGNCYMGDECVFRPHLLSNNCAYFTEKTKTGLPPKGENKMIDMVNKPPHYIEGRKYEPIKVIQDWGLDFCLGNVVKYISRAGRKTDLIEKEIEDLKKAEFYLNYKIKELELNQAINNKESD